MAAEGFQHGTPLEAPANVYLTPPEREALRFHENNLAIAGLTQEAEARIAQRRAALERWREGEVVVSVRAWALRYADAPEKGAEGTAEPTPYTDDEPHEEKGGWTPPDRYVVLDVHDNAIEGVMAWIRPAIDLGGRRYEVLGRLIEFVSDADIQKYWNGQAHQG